MSGAGARTIGIGIVGSRFMARIHYDSLQRIPGTRVLAVASPTGDHARAFAEARGIPHWFHDYHDLMAVPGIDIVIVTTPNDLHAPVTIAAARAGKHVIVEKPLCRNLVEADAMLAACREAGVKLMYAEEFCFAPKYVRAKAVVDEGAIGRVFRMNHTETGRGPANPWYWDVERSGGWTLMQNGSHALGVVRWMLDRPRATSVYARMGQHTHRDRGRGDDDVVLIVEFGDDLVAVVSAGWGKLGGADDQMELIGTGGVVQADLYFGSGFRTYSQPGYGYSSPGGGPVQGWTTTVYDELYNNGFPQEIAHFVACVRDDLPPQETGEDGRAVLEIITAAYESARTGRKVALPFHSAAERPLDHWWPPADAAPRPGPAVAVGAGED